MLGMQAMKHIVAALVSVLLLAACVSGSSSPWNQTAARPAEQAPSALTHPGAQDPRLAYYRGLAHTVPHGAAQTGAPPAAATADTAYAPVPAPALPSVKVALLVPLSGPHAELGQGMLNAAQLALFDMGYDTFELMPRDTGNTPEAARQAAISAMQDGAQLILGPVFADAVRAVKPVAAQRGVNVVAFSTDWTLAGGNTYIMGFLPFGQVRRVTEYAAMNGIRRVGILAPDNEYGSAVINAYMAAAQETGMPAPAITRFPANQRDISDIVSRFADYDARMAQFAPRFYVSNDS